MRQVIDNSRTIAADAEKAGRVIVEETKTMNRRYQSGCIQTRGTRRKVYVLRYYLPVLQSDGRIAKKRKSEMLGLASEIGSKRQARLLARPILDRVNLGRQRPQSVMTFEQYVHERWAPAVMPLLDPISLKLKPDMDFSGFIDRPGSAVTYGSVLRLHLIPAFGRRQLNEISRWDVQSFLTQKLQQGFSGAHVHGMRTTLSKVLQTAVEWGFLENNPARGCRIANRISGKKRTFLSPAEVHRLIAALPEPCRSIVHVAVITGFRIGEILALRWGRVDFPKGTIAVEESYSGHFGPPKTRSSRRVLSLSSALRQILAAQRIRLERLSPTDLVFCTHKGTPLSQQNLRNRVLDPTRKALGLPRVSWHTFRYTHATWLSEAQVSPRIAQSILGHSDVSMTLNIYTQVVEESQRIALERVGAAMDPNGPKFGFDAKSQTSMPN